MWSYFLNAVFFRFCLIFKERWSYFIHCVHCVHCIYCAHFGQTYLIWVKPHSFVQQQNVNLESLKSFSAIFFLCLESFIFFFFVIAATFFRGIERTRAYLFKNRRICLLLSTNKLLMCIAIVVHDIIAPLKMGIKRCWLDLNLLRCNWSHCCPRRLCVTTEFVQNVRIS